MPATAQGRGRDTFRAMARAFGAAETVARWLPRRTSRTVLVIGRNSNSKLARAARYIALRRIAHTCGDLVDVRASCFLLSPDNLSLGSRISIHPFCYIDATGGLTIGNDVSIAHGVSILTTEHVFSDTTVPIRDQGVVSHPTRIGSDVWIGAGARILAGVSIGNGSVVAAGSVVKNDVPAGAVVAGVPARVIKSRLDRGAS